MTESREPGRALPLVASVVLLLLLAGLTVAVFFPRSTEIGDLNGDPDAVDQLVMIDTRDAFAAGATTRASMTTQPAGVTLDDTREKSFPREGGWTGEVVTAFGATEVIPSWNIDAPPGTGVAFHIRTKDSSSGKWSPWLYIGQWGRTQTSIKNQLAEFPGGEVELDNLRLRNPASTIQLRATLQSFDPENRAKPTIRRVAIAYRGKVTDADERVKFAPPKLAGTWAKELPVPFIPQGDSPPPLRSQICSPTSTTMVMRYAGVKVDLVPNAMEIYDYEHDLFGNWGRAVAGAGAAGLDAYLTRFTNWDGVKAMIEQDQPVIASIRFRKGDMPNNPLMQETAGHLIVIRGFKPNGDVIVNDPASRKLGNAVVYKADELATAWFTRAGGVAYIIKKPVTAATRPTTAPSTRKA